MPNDVNILILSPILTSTSKHIHYRYWVHQKIDHMNPYGVKRWVDENHSQSNTSKYASKYYTFLSFLSDLVNWIVMHSGW